uniref:Peroxiredoxin 6 n=1 Tax=Neolamprologus brichardi TaxID=32507 RepID=A0A3Q4MGT5_NEOBR
IHLGNQTTSGEVGWHNTEKLTRQATDSTVYMIANSVYTTELNQCCTTHTCFEYLMEGLRLFLCESACCSLPFPIIADSKRELAVALGMLDPDERDKDGMPLTARCVFIIGPDKKLKLSLLYPATTGRNFDEILRVVDSLQLTAGKRVATPADWKPGNCVMVPPSMSEEEAASLFPAGVYTKDLPSGKKYLRYTPQP